MSRPGQYTQQLKNLKMLSQGTWISTGCILEYSHFFSCIDVKGQLRTDTLSLSSSFLSRGSLLSRGGNRLLALSIDSYFKRYSYTGNLERSIQGTQGNSRQLLHFKSCCMWFTHRLSRRTSVWTYLLVSWQSYAESRIFYQPSSVSCFDFYDPWPCYRTADCYSFPLHKSPTSDL